MVTVIDTRQKKFAMIMQLRQCVARAKSLQLKKSQEKPDFVWLFLNSEKSQWCS